MLLGHLTCQECFPVWPEDSGQLVHQTFETHGRIKENQRNVDSGKCPQAGLTDRAPWGQKTLEMKPGGWKSRYRQGSQDGRRTRYRRDPEPGLVCGRNKPATRIAQEWSSRI